MALIRWREGTDLFSQLDRMQREVASLMGAFRPWTGNDFATFRPEVYPPLNIYDNGEAFVVRAEVPGVDPKSLEIEATGDTLTLRGERTVAEAGPKASYHRREREAGEFRRSLTLPKPVDSSKVVANCDSGVLELQLPYAEEAKRRKITVKSA